MLLIGPDDYKSMPWKNGGGITTEIAVSPPGATLDDFDWRISMATVNADGPFSLFPGVDRTLSVLTGSGIELSMDDARYVITRTSEPLYFKADIPVESRLIDGPLADLNVMTRRTSFTHEVNWLDISKSQPLDAAGASMMAIYCQDGKFFAAGEQKNFEIAPGFTLLVEPESDPMPTISGNGAGYAIRLFRR